MSAKNVVMEMLSEDMGAVEGDITLPAEDAQAALDDALHDSHEAAEEAFNCLDALEVVDNGKVALESLQLELKASLESGGASDTLFHTVRMTLESCYRQIGDYTSIEAFPSLESIGDDRLAQTTVSLEVVAEGIARFDRWLTGGISKFSLSISQFFAGTQRVSKRAMDVLAHADRILDTAGEPTTKQLSLTGAAARSIQCGKKTVSIHEACQIVNKVGKETAEHWIPSLVEYAHGMANAFGQSDLSKIRDTFGFTKRGFMSRAQAFADVKPVVPSFCTIQGDKRYFFKLIRDAYKQTSSSEPLPGNRQVEVTHPVGNLKTYLEREDIHGFFETFPHWLSVDVIVKKAEGFSGNSTVLTLPSVGELRQDITAIREVVKDIRQLTIKSEEVKHAMTAMLDAYESHVYKRWDSVMDKVVNLTVGTLPNAHLVFTFYGGLALSSSRSMYQTILQMGKYLSTECHGLATVALKCSNAYKAKQD